jgi:uncharacterized membrane protein
MSENKSLARLEANRDGIFAFLLLTITFIPFPTALLAKYM